MGNCQASEAATVLIQHPNGPAMKFYHSLSASHVMASNPGHYVAIITTSPPVPNPSGAGAAAAVKYLKLLRPADKLHIGHIYRLISFQEVLSEFASKKKVRLSKLIVEENRMSDRSGGGDISPPAKAAALLLRPAPWKPALESIGEIEIS